MWWGILHQRKPGALFAESKLPEFLQSQSKMHLFSKSK